MNKGSGNHNKKIFPDNFFHNHHVDSKGFNGKRYSYILFKFKIYLYDSFTSVTLVLGRFAFFLSSRGRDSALALNRVDRFRYRQRFLPAVNWFG